MTFEYKTVGAPEKGKRQRGARTHSDRVAVAFDEVLQEEAVDGWEYQRTDLLPVTERSGWLGRGHEVHRAVMVFRRSLAPEDRSDQGDLVLKGAGALRQAPLFAPSFTPAPEPTVSADPNLRIAESVRGPGNYEPGE
ncbi:MAG TPA: DUF4177 domain-containing protein [Thermohalobaculum sp.]|nr:DUF4177 domain-containing protein [Thermohalobaculum sp.]